MDKIEQVITANGISCRNCTGVGSPETQEPTCLRHQLETAANMATGKAVFINRFCSLVRQPDEPCGPEGRTYVLRVAT